uniref:folate gamma-glutamyl hydrolase n=1 Tax=Timema shepardi TaxID=629360 RepID=A0A7R9B0E5_TIMSH|nr:unnamed protein product [Timema shepardi]
MLAYPRIVPGVLVLELSKAMRKELGEDSNRYQSHLPASYVKFVEGSGGRVVPIMIGRKKKYYKNLMKSLNGVLFPGGAVNFEDADGYAAAGANLLDLATEANQNGDYFPVWGTCLGFQLLTYLAAGRREHRADCYSTQQTLPLEFRTGILQSTEHLYGVLTATPPSRHFLWSSEQNRYTGVHKAPIRYSNRYSTQQTLPLEFRTGILQSIEHLLDFRDSKMFRNAPDHVIEILKTKDVNANFHSYCVTEKNMTKMGLIPDWRILATNHDLNGLEFVSVIESRDFPYYGVIAHPEKNPYEFNPTRNYPHSAGAVVVAQFFANFFVDEALKRGNPSYTTSSRSIPEPGASSSRPTSSGNNFPESCRIQEQKNSSGVHFAPSYFMASARSRSIWTEPWSFACKDIANFRG